MPKSTKDDFNFFHSSAHITVECAFGEIDLRWGIFWKCLKCSLDHATLIIEGSMRLHNFLVDYRESKLPEDKRVDELIEEQLFHDELSDNGINPIVVVNDSNRGSGNITNNEKESRLNGLKLRDRLKISLMNHDLNRPRK